MEIRWTRADDREGFITCVQTAGLSPTPEQLAYYLDSAAVGTYVAVDGNQVVGTGSVTAYAGGTGWLGALTALPGFRGQGLGTTLTEWGIQALRDQGARSIRLAATRAGRPLYEKMGFVAGGEYLNLMGRGLRHPPRDARLRPLFYHDWPAVEKLDFTATGEKRGTFLRTMRTGYVLVSNDGRLTGFHLEAPWGGGASVAADAESGRILIDLARGLRGERPIRLLLPEANLAAVVYAEGAGFEVASRTTFMVQGPWPEPYAPEFIWGMFSFGLG